MADTDYATVKIPVHLAKTVDKYLETEHARKHLINSRADLVNNLLAKFFEEYEGQYGAFVNREVPPKPKTK